jgi:hypothetical protein
MNSLMQSMQGFDIALELSSVLKLSFALVLGGILAVYIRFLYNRFSSSVSNIDAISGSFPLLTLVTAGVIAVVKGSLALSLGLVGALSIVRFRAPIKDPEELVYLFLCIGVGIAIGAGYYLYAVALVVIATVFVVGQWYFRRGSRWQNLIVTVAGDAERYFDDPSSGALAVVKELTSNVSIQRYDIEDGQGVMRIVVGKLDDHEAAEFVAKLHKRLPQCTISYLNMNNVL